MLSRNEQHRRFLKLLDLYEPRLARKVGREINRVNRTALRTFQRTGNIVFDDLIDEHTESMAQILSGHYSVIMPKFSDQVLDMLGVTKSHNYKFDVTLIQQLIDRWITTNGLAQASLIAGTTIENIRKVLQESIRAGEGVAETSRKIARISGLTPIRANTIAVTETHNAATYSNIESVRRAQGDLDVVLYKKWMPTADERTRSDHAAMLNTPAIPLDQKFDVGGEKMDRAGDPTASARNVVRCRCAIVYEPPSFDIV